MIQRTVQRTVQGIARRAFFATSTLVLAGALLAPSANAASVLAGDFSAFGRFDWSRLEVVTSSGAATLDPIFSPSFGGVGVDPNASAGDAAGRGFTTDWVTARDAGADFPGGGRAEFELGADDVIASAATNSATAAAQAARGRTYDVTGSGTVDIRVPYEYELGAAAGGSSRVTFLLDADGAPAQALSFLITDDTLADSGTIELQLAVTDGVAFTFNSDIISEVAAVPVPAAWLLFASALLVLRRRAPRA